MVNVVEIGPAVIEEEKIVEVNATTEEVQVGIISAAVEERLEPSKEDPAVVKPAVSPTPGVETEISVETKLAKEEIPATELVAHPIVEVEEAHVLEAIAPVVEQDKVVESELTQDEVTINEPIAQLPALEIEVSPAVEESIVLEQPASEETNTEDVGTNAVTERISTIEEVVIPVLTTREPIETEVAEPLPVVQPIIEPSVPVIDTIPATEPEALEQAKLDKISVDNEDTQVDTEAVPSVEEVIEPVFVPVDSASEDIVIVEQEETKESAPPASETLLPSGVEEEAIPESEHLEDVFAVSLADEDSKERDASVISANMEVDIEEKKEEGISVEGFSMVPEPITSNEEWEEVIAIPESEPAAQVVQQQVEEVPVVPVIETIALDEDEGFLVPEAEPAVQVAEEKAEENVEVVETEIVMGPLTDDHVEAKKEDEDEQMKVEGAEEEVVKEAEPEHVDEMAEETAKEIEGNAEDVEKAKEVEVENVVERKEGIATEVEEAKEVEAEIVHEMAKETTMEVEDKSVEVEKEDTEDEANKVEETAGEVEQPEDCRHSRG